MPQRARGAMARLAGIAWSWGALLGTRGAASQAAGDAPWECHHYVGDQESTSWCATAGIQERYEYKYFPSGVGASCPPCWCCKRKVEAVAGEAPSVAFVDALAVQAVAPPPPAAEQQQPYSWEAPQQQQPTTSTTTAVHYDHHIATVAGVQSGVLAGIGGKVNGDAIDISHGDGLTLFSDFRGKWRPEGLAQLKLLGNMLTFTVDLSAVGCACNLKMFLHSAPALDWVGKPDPGGDRGEQPPYYCDANAVGGQWCPEVDIMEANNHVFQATLHKCDATSSQGHYEQCDRGGCGESTKDRDDAYGPGEKYEIDTTRPFHVQTEFFEGLGVLVGMRTTLQQGGKQIVMSHRECLPGYLAKMSGSLAEGMSLRMTYWGDDAENMAWLDKPICGVSQACSGSSAGAATISNVTVGRLPAWTFSNREDVELYRKRVPEDVVADPDRFVALGERGVAEWKNSEHYVLRVPAGSAEASDVIAVEADTSALVKKTEVADSPRLRPLAGSGGEEGSHSSFHSSLLGIASSTATVAAGFVCLAVLGVCWSGSRGWSCRSRGGTRGAALPSPPPPPPDGRSSRSVACASGAGPSQNSMGMHPLKGSRPSCQLLLAMAEGEC